MTTDYTAVKKWRQKTKKNAAYNANFMREQRKMYGHMYRRGQIAYEDIPKSYRTFKKFSP